MGILGELILNINYLKFEIIGEIVKKKIILLSFTDPYVFPNLCEVNRVQYSVTLILII